MLFFFFSSRRRHTRFDCDWSSDVCSSDLLVDTDDVVGSKFGISIPEIFSKYGEQGFREAETQTLRELDPAKPTIIVTGGGIVLRAKNVDFLKRLGIIVWLDGNEETLFERASRARIRPLLQGEHPREAFAPMLQ